MNEKNLVICDKVLRYAKGLSENIFARNEFSLRVHICTSLESVLQFKKEREIHLLIIDDSFSYAEREQVHAEQTFILTKETCPDLGEGEKEIYKYQSADKILAEVFETYYERTNTNILKYVKKERKKLITVYSPIQRIGKTTFAIALGRELAKSRRTLYLNLESYADIGGRFVKAEGRNLGDLLYYMHQEGGNMSMRISTTVLKMENLDYIPPFLLNQDIKDITPNEWQRFLTIILEDSIYETVILDLSDSIQGLPELLQCSDKIYMPILEDSISKKKINLFDEMMGKMQLRDLREKTCRFTAEDDMAACAKRIAQEEM